MGKYMLEALKGETPHQLARRAVDYVNQIQRECQILCDGVIVTVYVGSHDLDIVEKWDFKRQVMRLEGRL